MPIVGLLRKIWAYMTKRPPQSAPSCRGEHLRETEGNRERRRERARKRERERESDRERASDGEADAAEHPAAERPLLQGRVVFLVLQEIVVLQVIASLVLQVLVGLQIIVSLFLRVIVRLVLQVSAPRPLSRRRGAPRRRAPPPARERFVFSFTSNR